MELTVHHLELLPNLAYRCHIDTTNYHNSYTLHLLHHYELEDVGGDAGEEFAAEFAVLGSAAFAVVYI